MAEIFANSGDPDQMPHSAASDLGLHCLLHTLLGDSRLQRVKKEYVFSDNSGIIFPSSPLPKKKQKKNKKQKKKKKKHYGYSLEAPCPGASN